MNERTRARTVNVVNPTRTTNPASISAVRNPHAEGFGVALDWAHAGEGRERKSGKGQQGACTTAPYANVSADPWRGHASGVPEDVICCHARPLPLAYHTISFEATISIHLSSNFCRNRTSSKHSVTSFDAAYQLLASSIPSV